VADPHLAPDAARPGGWTLLVDGVEQSYVDVEWPRFLKHSYVRRIASVIDTAAPARTALRVLHLGGGGLTLPRYIAATRPGSAQLVIERDAALDAFVRARLPLPDGADIRTVTGDARAVVEALDGAFDLVINDVYEGAQMPTSVASVEFAGEVARVLAPAGCYIVNVTDLPLALYSRMQAATLGAVFADVCAIGEPGLLRGRRYGNVVLAAGAALPAARIARIARISDRDEVRAKVLTGPELDEFIGGVGPTRDA
jgi:spermidine synthase